MLEFVGGVSVLVLFVLWAYVNEQQALEEHELYDKDKVKYTDGDNT